MSSDLLDEWDESFLEQAIQLELDATSSRNPIAKTTTFNSLPPPQTFPQPNNVFENSTGVAYSCGDRPFPLHTTVPPCPNSAMDLDLGFSPPRELTQRIPKREEDEGVRVGKDDFPVGLEETFGGFDRGRSHGMEEKHREIDSLKKVEIESLKKEVRRVSKQLTQKEEECSGLLKDKARKDAELKLVFSQLKAKDVEISNLKMVNLQNSKLDRLVTRRVPDNPDSFTHEGYRPYPNVGDTGQISGHTKEVERVVSTGKTSEPPGQVGESSLRSLEIRKKESQNNIPSHPMDLKISGTTSNSIATASLCLEQRLDKKQMGVQTEFDRDSSKDESVPCGVSRMLFAIWGSPCNSMSGGHLISKLFSTCSTDFCEIFSPTSDAIRCSDMARLHHFNEILIKISRGMEDVETLFRSLLDLGMAENVVIVCRSLHILRAALQIIMGSHSNSYERKNIIVCRSEDVNLSENANDAKKKMESEKILDTNEDNLKHSFERVCKNAGDFNGIKSFHSDFLIFLIKGVQKVMANNTNEQVLVDSLSLMNLIVLGSGHRSKKEGFGVIILEGLPKYLHEDIGLHVRYEALQLLFLLLNCSELLQMFCKQYEVYCAEVSDAPDSSLLAGTVKPILEALAVCLMRKGSNILELKLTKKAVIILAFISSLGNSGAEVLRFSVTSQEANFLDLITQLLASEIDEVDGSVLSQDLLKERFALVREALILLNRLAANASCSRAILGSLTRNHASSSLAVHVASSISQKGKGYWKYDTTNRLQVMEAEIIDLARSFRARVLSFIAGSMP